MASRWQRISSRRLTFQLWAFSGPIMGSLLRKWPIALQQLYDFATNFIRTQLATVQGSSIPLPYGGKTRAVSVDLDPSKLAAYDISPQEVANAINQQSVVLPSGTAKIGVREYDVLINGSTNTIEALNNLPVKQVDRTTIYIRDIANVRDGYTPQVNLVVSSGIKAALLPVLKNGDASTLDVVGRVYKALPSWAKISFH